jgi:hypothetical protein
VLAVVIGNLRSENQEKHSASRATRGCNSPFSITMSKRSDNENSDAKICGEEDEDEKR